MRQTQLRIEIHVRFIALILLCRLTLIHVLFLGSSVSASFVVPNLLGYRLLNLSCSSVRFNLIVSMNRPILWLAASRLYISASGRRPAAHTSNFGVVIHFPPDGYLPLPPVLRLQVHSSLGLPRVLSCRSLPCCFPCVRSHLFPPLLFIRLIAFF
jgi:hypothetical protein